MRRVLIPFLVGSEFSHDERTQGVQHMNWTTPIVVEVCAGMEVTAYLSAQM
jgi:coenzyme PQQ precursor peptide PqqA